MLSTILSLRDRYRIAAQNLEFEFSNLKFLSLKANFDPSEPRDNQGQWTRRPDGVLVQRNGRTGNRRIDNTTDIIVDAVSDIVGQNGPGKGPLYGVAIHSQSAALIRSLDLPGIGSYGVEQSFSAGDTVQYGLDGSVRTDVVLRDGRTIDAPIIAIYDIKTGGAKLTPSRVREIRASAGVDESVPVIEIHVTRGVRVKSLVHFLTNGLRKEI